MEFKVFGLPRTSTNWVSYNVMKTWGTRVWQNKGGWKHGKMVETGVDGYILCERPLEEWKESVKRWSPKYSKNNLDEIWEN